MEREIELDVTTEEFVRRLRELAHAIEAGDAYTVSLQDVILRIPSDAQCRIEFEESDSEVELEFEVRWRRAESSAVSRKGEVDDALS
jgi:amphi-Trp domain-containing protein